MWLIENLIRAFDFDVERIVANLSAAAANEGKPYTDGQVGELRKWYGDLCEMMLREGLREQGHLPMVANTLLEIEEFHLMLLRLGKDMEYVMKWRGVEGLVTILKSRSSKPATMGDIEMCITFLYLSINLAKTGRLTDETAEAKKRISNFCGLLSERYRDWKENNEEL